MRTKTRILLLSSALVIFCTVFAILRPVSASDTYGAVKPFAKHGILGAEIVFSEEDLAENLIGNSRLTGLLVTASVTDGGAFLLGNTPVSDGTVIPREQFSELLFRPEADTVAGGTLDFLPLFADGSAEVSGAASRITVHSGGERNFAPSAADLRISGYRNIDIPVALSAYDREGDALTYTVVTAPERGTLSVVNGQLIYTPAANKSGTAEFSYYAADAAGNTSDVATVTVLISKQETDVFYSDLTDSTLQHAAVCLAENGIYRGRTVGSDMIFDADASVSRGEFIALASAALSLPLDSPVSAVLTEACGWQGTYIAAAMEAQIVSGARFDDAVTGAEAAAIVSRLLDAQVTGVITGDTVPAWAAADAYALSALGVLTDAGQLSQTLTRGDAVELLARALAVKNGDRLGWSKYDAQ